MDFSVICRIPNKASVQDFSDLNLCCLSERDIILLIFFCDNALSVQGSAKDIYWSLVFRFGFISLFEYVVLMRHSSGVYVVQELF